MLSFLRTITRKTSDCIRGSLVIIGRLFGIKRIHTTKYNTKQLVTAGWIFFLGIPVGLAVFGPQFPTAIWAVIVLSILAIVNLDDALTLTATFAEYGVDGEILPE